MYFFLDSAEAADVERAAFSGIVTGITTNPTLLHDADPGLAPLAHVVRLLHLFPNGPVFHQVHTSPDWSTAQRVVDDLLEATGENASRLVFKLPAQPFWFSLGTDLVRRGSRVAFTAVYSPGQFLAATQVGAHYVIPYVDRARRLRPADPDVLSRLRSVKIAGAPQILAASLKSRDQAVEAFRNGADAITAPWAVLNELMQDELTDSAVEQFRAAVPW